MIYFAPAAGQVAQRSLIILCAKSEVNLCCIDCVLDYSHHRGVQERGGRRREKFGAFVLRSSAFCDDEFSRHASRMLMSVGTEDSYCIALLLRSLKSGISVVGGERDSFFWSLFRAPP